MKEILGVFPENFEGRYFEPFLGGGAVLFAGDFGTSAIAGDKNEELINCYLQVRDSSEELISMLSSCEFENTSENYYQIRKWDRNGRLEVERTPLERAARFIFLNRFGFNGVYRVNSRGEYNVPYGGAQRNRTLDSSRLLAASESLQGVAFEPMSYKELLRKFKPEAGDLVYFDPPYDPVSETSAFVGYTSQGFNSFDQEDLANSAIQLATEGVHVVLSNSDTDLIRRLYLFEGSPFAAKHVSIPVRRSVSAAKSSRGYTAELILVS